MPGARCPECGKKLNFVLDINEYWKNKKAKKNQD